MIDFTVAVDKLRSLETPDEIAAFLTHQGVVGEVGRVESCPIANWVSSVTGRTVTVIHGEVNAHISGTLDWDTEPNSKAMKEFIYSFDAENYPALIKNHCDKLHCEEESWQERSAHNKM